MRWEVGERRWHRRCLCMRTMPPCASTCVLRPAALLPAAWRCRAPRVPSRPVPAAAAPQWQAHRQKLAAAPRRSVTRTCCVRELPPPQPLHAGVRRWQRCLTTPIVGARHAMSSTVSWQHCLPPHCGCCIGCWLPRPSASLPCRRARRRAMRRPRCRRAACHLLWCTVVGMLRCCRTAPAATRWCVRGRCRQRQVGGGMCVTTAAIHACGITAPALTACTAPCATACAT